MSATPADRPYAVLDIDGVLADASHRLHYLAPGRKNWDAFFAAAPKDPPLPEGVEVARTLAHDHDIAYVTGRPSRYRGDTLTWLQKHGLPPGLLIMRAAGDRRPAELAKLGAIRRLAGTRSVSVVVDDDPDVCAAVRQAGFTVFEATWAPAEPDSTN
jgi:beta-phosphoglucomutase-like phosphatase (HAD superfamily)